VKVAARPAVFSRRRSIRRLRRPRALDADDERFELISPRLWEVTMREVLMPELASLIKGTRIAEKRYGTDRDDAACLAAISGNLGEDLGFQSRSIEPSRSGVVEPTLTYEKLGFGHERFCLAMELD
jgi:hypothetical protein